MLLSNVKFANIVCRFENFGSNSFCDSWKWKVDPYKCDDKDYSLKIRNMTSTEDYPVMGNLLYNCQDGFFMRQVFEADEKKTVWRYIRKKNGNVLLAFLVSEKLDEIVLLEDNTHSNGQMAFEYLGHLFPMCILNQKILNFHGVLLEYHGAGIIISAPSGTGKTTHARLWRDYKNALIINGDRATCGKEDNVWQGWGLPWSGTSGEQINRKVKIKAMVVLERSLQNEAHLVDKKDRLRYVLPHLQCPTWDSELVGMGLDLLDDFLLQIPVIRLCCRADNEAVDVLEQVLKKIVI